MTDGWEVTPKTVPIELVPNFDHADFVAEPTPGEVMSGSKVMDRLDEVMRQRVHELYGII